MFSLKRILISAAIVLFTAGIIYSITQNEKAPEFELESVDGSVLKLSDLKGKVVLLDFWATWCPPCRAAVPDLVELQAEYGENLVVVGISLDGDQTKKDVKPFMEQYEINYPVVWGTMNTAKDYGNIRAIPTSFIVDQEGNIVGKWVGMVEKIVYKETIDKLLE